VVALRGATDSAAASPLADDDEDELHATVVVTTSTVTANSPNTRMPRNRIVSPVDIRDAAAADLDATTLYKILKLRVDVFVVEQSCAYPELDGRDLEPGTRQLWIERSGDVVATLRALDEGAALRIGRVATAANARSAGLARRLMQRALTLAGDRDVVLDAQSYLARWYEGFGFVQDGDEFVEDGIAHVPMRRRATRREAGGGAPTSRPLSRA
jgi:ElaA protein